MGLLPSPNDYNMRVTDTNKGVGRKVYIGTMSHVSFEGRCGRDHHRRTSIIVYVTYSCGSCSRMRSLDKLLM
jgi:hypothetical protein